MPHSWASGVMRSFGAQGAKLFSWDGSVCLIAQPDGMGRTSWHGNSYRRPLPCRHLSCVSIFDPADQRAALQATLCSTMSPCWHSMGTSLLQRLCGPLAHTAVAPSLTR